MQYKYKNIKNMEHAIKHTIYIIWKFYTWQFIDMQEE